MTNATKEKPANAGWPVLGVGVGESEVYAERERLTVSQWAEQKRVLSKKTTELDGAWSHELTPFLVEIMDCLSDATTRDVTLMKCSQAGGTEVLLNFLGWIVDQSPGPTLIVMPREDDAKRRLRTRVKPLFESNPDLMKHLDGGKLASLNIGQETELDHMICYLAWSGSPAALADNPVCYVIPDEVGKYPARSGDEADPISLAKDRQRTYSTRSKLYAPSTPVMENDLIDREYQRGDQRKWWAKCVHCHERHVMAWSNVDLDKTEAGALLAPGDYANGGHARYVCPHCGVAWSEEDRWSAVSNGLWRPKDFLATEVTEELENGSDPRERQLATNEPKEKPANGPGGRQLAKQGATKSAATSGSVDAAGVITEKPANAGATHRSYHISALMLHPHFQTVDNLAKKWADAQLDKAAGDIGALQNFINSELGEPWKEKAKETDISKLRTHIGSFSRGVVPEGVVVLTAAADIQLDHMWVKLIGWGYMSECWCIEEARLETGDTANLANYRLLTDFLTMGWPLASDPKRKMHIAKAGIDCGYHTDTVYDFCRATTLIDVVPVRGDDSVKAATFRVAKVAGGTMVRYDLNVNVLKDRLHRLMYAETPGPGYYHLHRETTGETLQHLTSEEQRRVRIGSRTQTIWQKKDSHRANHLFDCDVYAAFVAELVGVRLIRDPNAPPLPGRQVGIKQGYGK